MVRSVLKGTVLALAVLAASTLVFAAAVSSGRMREEALILWLQGTCAVACAAGGILAGKGSGERYLVSGCSVGILTALLRTTIVLLCGNASGSAGRTIPFFLLCAAGGAAGGLLSGRRKRR